MSEVAWDQLLLQTAPQITGRRTTRTIMRDVLIALAPACVASVWIFGTSAALTICVSVVACVGLEWAWCRARRLPPTISDLSAAVTGVLLAMNLPAGFPPQLIVCGAFVAIIVCKELFGGIGCNICNPAIVGRIFLSLSFPVAMSVFPEPRVTLGASELVSGATPLASAQPPDALTLFLGTYTGALGETCTLALLIGACWLLARRVITWHIPVGFMALVAALSALAGRDVASQLMSGGLVLGAFFMATDYATTPATRRGKVVFALGCALITCLIRFFGNLEEGVAYSILFMNLLVPVIDAHTANVPLGAERRRKVVGGGDDG